MPPEPTATPSNNQSPTTGYRFLNVQKEEKRSADKPITEKAGNAVGNTAKVAGTSLKAAGTAVQTTGAAIRVAGAATSAAGNGISAVGLGLSATGVGAVVGVPLNAAGRVVNAGGKVIGLGGKATSTAGKTMRRAGSAVNRVGNNVKNATKKAVTAVKIIAPFQTRMIQWMILVAFFVLFVLQHVAALLSLGFLTLAAGSSAIANYFDIVGDVLGWIANAITAITGFDLSITNNMAGVFFFFHYIALTIGVASLLLAGLINVLSLKSPFWGDMAPVKIGVFIVVIMGICMPVFNLLPWAIIWIWIINELDT